MNNLPERLPNHKPEPAKLRLLAHSYIDASLKGMAQACPNDAVCDAAYMLMRDAAMHLHAIVGSERAAEKLFRLADEMVGLK